jgi:hypothetical protein
VLSSWIWSDAEVLVCFPFVLELKKKKTKIFRGAKGKGEKGDDATIGRQKKLKKGTIRHSMRNSFKVRIIHSGCEKKSHTKKASLGAGIELKGTDLLFSL